MELFPTLRTERLVLRQFAMADAPELHRLAQAREVARMMLHLPHPYEEGMAEEWIKGLRPMFESGKGTTFAVVLREGGTLIGTASLYTRAPDGTAVLGEEGTGLLGFWIGVPYWNEGYATEAVAERGFGATPPAETEPDLEVPDLESLVHALGLRGL